ncbi:MAG: CPBP family intramembrane metalloprotease [Acidimicrobiales bacterium]|jgi:membrane protease YdiL (CAAX protease family)|nr:CPBP family intramembrane metalloprotease [Acidimicrobiales bacterium]
MRIKPSPLVAIGVILGYLVVVFAVWAATGLDYDNVADTVENVQKGVVLAVGLGSVYLAVMTTVLGWWKPAIHEPRKVGGGWMWIVPAMLVVGAALNFAATKWGEIDGVGTYVLWLAIGTLFVGFSEELLTRGLAIVGGRGSMHEKWVWAFSGAIFALIHVPNIFFGQDVGPTLQQVVFAFAVGLTYYVTRRIAGTLIVTMVLHALWDFSTFIQAHSVDKLDNPTASLGSFAMYLAVIIGIFALVKILKTGDVVEPGGDQLAAFDGAPADRSA